MAVTRGDVVLLNYPFSSGQGAKVRPALVVQSDQNNSRLTNTIVAMITRAVQHARHEPTQYYLDPATSEGTASGVLHPSAIKCENLLTVEQRLILRTIGHLSSAAMHDVNRCLMASLDLL